jgi:hypothetical protein
MVAALVCREMGWTWQEYQSQPSWFAKIVSEMIRAESEQLEKNAKKNG